MGYSLSKADELYCSGEKEKAIEILEKFVSNRDISKITRKTIRAYESMAVYKYQMGKDYSKEIAVLSEMDNDDLFGFTFFLMGLHYESIGDKQKAFEKFNFYVERVNDAEQFADSLEAKDDWLRVEKEFFKGNEKTEHDDLYSKCSYGENIDVLTEKEKEFILCENFVEEVNSGGFESYFSSEFSRYCIETADILKKCKSKTYSQALKKAVKLFPDDFDFSNCEKTQDYMDEHEKMLDKFEKIEDKIYDSDEDIESILEKLKEQIQ